MKKSDLKELIKPLVKECIHEALIEEGLLSNIVSEVAKGMQGNLVVEAPPNKKKRDEALFEEGARIRQKAEDSQRKLKEHRKKLMESIGSEAYGGINLFEGTEPMTAASPPESKAGSVDLGDPRDSGVDISSLVNGASQIWKAMK
jgi:hypothetical protein|tara:strand:+ start:1462 stop:1896 length:435 start_codon:yes stop_codon:yes gene_type:complete